MIIAIVELTNAMAGIQVAIVVSVIDSHPGHQVRPARSDQQLA